MIADEVLAFLPVATWDGPFDTGLQHRAVEALEAGCVLVLQDLPFQISDTERPLLEPSSQGGRRKNISLDPATGRLSNANLPPAETGLLTGLLQRYAAATTRLVCGLVPAYAEALECARTSFRPAEIAGRRYSPRHDDRRLHVDAFPHRPMAGRRILRVFCNVAPDGAAREWQVGESFPDFARRFLPRLRPALPGSAWAMQRLGLTKGRRSRYDHLMLGLHDAAKLDAAYQASGPRVTWRFAVGTAWLCFTDQVLHAALSGHGALEQTFHVPVQALAHPQHAPLRVLEQLAGRALV